MKPKYILWNPESQLPPTRTFDSITEAVEVAESMARKHAPQTFHVCKIVGYSRISTAPVETKIIKGEK